MIPVYLYVVITYASLVLINYVISKWISPNKPKHFVQSFTFNVDVRMMLLHLQLLA